MGAEYEVKFQACDACQTAIREAFPGNWNRICMQTTYYDTPSGSLSARRYTLRRRLENGISVCTLKTPGKDGLRGEWEVTCASVEESISMLCKLGCPDDLEALCQEGLLPICGAQFTRDAQTLTFAGCTLELALDQGILFSGDRQQPLSEVEAELKSGSKDALDAFARELAAQYHLLPESKSKFARALELYKEG